MSETTARKLRVMVVDDQEGVRWVVADTVKYGGHDVVATAVDGQEAVELARTHRPDVVIMDIQMPRLKGPEAMDAMLREGTVRRVILMSGEWQSAGVTVEELRSRGAAAFMEKPFSVTVLLDLLTQYAQEPTGV